ncbi:helix-turn-helix transcriptional regulator [Azospirillum doebereinerae]|uniref:DNA-binding protein n=1 Tax=Azospirillum doebereinerae TaxID=92933 RepID=A0A3S1CD33_9PROT|nr:hypothetical protein [Azospirillum doebereinerae]RUQ61977.1 hypothetical protein EJ913_29280 [Azospirillum doebereinerae]
MAAKVSDLEGLPNWPRMLSRAQAARYVGVSTTQFDKEVGEGRWPRPERRGSRITWDRALIDMVQDRSSGIVAPSHALANGPAADPWA